MTLAMEKMIRSLDGDNKSNQRKENASTIPTLSGVASNDINSPLISPHGGLSNYSNKSKRKFKLDVEEGRTMFCNEPQFPPGFINLKDDKVGVDNCDLVSYKVIICSVISSYVIDIFWSHGLQYLVIG